MHDSWCNNFKMFIVLAYQNCRLSFFRAFNIIRDIKNFVQILILLNKFQIVEISGNIERTKKADHILKKPWVGYFVIINSRILLLKLGCHINAHPIIEKNQRRPSRRLTILSCSVLWNISGTTLWPRSSSSIDFKHKDELNKNFKLQNFLFFLIALQ